MGETFDDFERRVFLGAVSFTSSLHRGSARYETLTFSTPHEAIQDALTRRDPYGRRPVVYAVNEEGRSVVLDRTRWLHWTALWDEHREEKHDDGK